MWNTAMNKFIFKPRMNYLDENEIECAQVLFEISKMKLQLKSNSFMCWVSLIAGYPWIWNMKLLCLFFLLLKLQWIKHAADSLYAIFFNPNK